MKSLDYCIKKHGASLNEYEIADIRKRAQGYAHAAAKGQNPDELALAEILDELNEELTGLEGQATAQGWVKSEEIATPRPAGEEEGAKASLAEITDREPPSFEGSIDRLREDAQFFTDLSVSKAFTRHGLSSLDIPSQRRVISAMLSGLHKPEIRKSIIGSVPVDVVDALSRLKVPAKVFLHDENMLQSKLLVLLGDDVSLRSDIADSMVRAIASIGAEKEGAPSKPILSTENGLSAVGTVDSNGLSKGISSTSVGAKKGVSLISFDKGWFFKYGLPANLASKIETIFGNVHSASINEITESISRVTGKSNEEVLGDYPKLKSPILTGRVWIQNGWRPFTEWRTIDKGKNKGKVEVIVAKMKRVVDRDKVSQWPGQAEEPKVEVKETKKGPVVSVDLAKKEEGKLSLKEQKAYLLEEIDKAIEEAPEEIENREAMSAIPHERGLTDEQELELKKKFFKDIKNPTPEEREALWSEQRNLEHQIGIGAINEYVTKLDTNPNYVTIEVPGDGKFRILNRKAELQEFKKRAGQFPISRARTKDVGKIPSSEPSAAKKEKIDELVKVTGKGGKEWFTDSHIAVKGQPPKSAKYGVREDTGKVREIPFENLKGVIPRKAIPAKLSFFAFSHPDIGEGISSSPVPKLSGEKQWIDTFVVFESKEGNKATFDQSRFNVIRNRYPNATYKLGGPEKDVGKTPLIAYENGEVVALIMPMKESLDIGRIEALRQEGIVETPETRAGEEEAGEEKAPSKAPAAIPEEEEPTAAKEVNRKDLIQATKFRKLADGLQKQIDQKRNPAIGQQNVTRRRAGIAEGMRRDADALEESQNIMSGMAEAIEAGTLPDSLKGLSNRAQIDAIRYAAKYDRKLSSLGDEEHKRLIQAGIKNDVALQEAKKDIQQYIKGPSKETVKQTEIKKAERELIGVKIPGFFPTPKAVGNHLVEMADIQPGMDVLEPSAGKGDLAEVIREGEPKANLKVIEWLDSLRNLLSKKGFEIIGNDFLEHQGKYDRIIQNPPFEKFQDVEHVQHAYDLLKPGGRLVSIMSESPFFRQDKKAQEFRDWFESVGGESEKLQGAFKGAESFRQTGVSGRIVTIDKMGEEERLSAIPPAQRTSKVHLTLREQDALDEVDDIILKALKQVLPPHVMSRVKTELSPLITPKGKKEAIKKSEEETGQKVGTILGVTRIRDSYALIEFAYMFDDASIQETAYHEGYHVVKRWLLPEWEKKVLNRAYGTEEKEARAFANWAMGKQEPKTLILRIFEKLRKYLNAIRSGLQGQGWTTPEMVFERIWGKKYQTIMAEKGVATKEEMIEPYPYTQERRMPIEKQWEKLTDTGRRAMGPVMAEKGEGRIPAETPQKAEGGVIDFSKDPEWNDIAYQEPTKEALNRLKAWLKANPYAIVRMYHGTDASIPVQAEGLKPTRATTAKSLQSRRGVVSVSIYPGMAETFGKMAYPGKDIAVYAVDLPVNRLIPDADQLRNKRMWGQRQDIGGTLADSIAYGHGAQVKGSIPIDWISRINESSRPPEQGGQAKTAEKGGFFMPEGEERLEFEPIAAGDVNTPEFRAWFKDSKVVDENGEPLVVYHSTREVFNSFQPLSHFGTADAAEERLKAYRGDGPIDDLFGGYEPTPRTGENTIPVYLNIANPLEIEDTGVDFFLSDLMEEAGVPSNEATRINKLFEEEDATQGVNELLNAIQSEGFDGFKYINEVEDPGSISWMPLRPTQIKSIFNRGTWSAEEADIRLDFEDLSSTYLDNALKELKGIEKKLQPRLESQLAKELNIKEEKAGKGPAWKSELFGTQDRPPFHRITDAIEDVRNNWQTRIFDRLYPIKDQLGNTAYMLHRLETGIQGVMATFMRHGIPKWNGKAITVDTRKQGFLEWYKGLGNDAEKLLYWIAAKRAERLEQETVKVGREERPKELWLLAPDRKKIFDWVGPKPETAKSWGELNDQFQAYNRGILDLAEHAGLIDPMARKTWEQHFYVPFYRIFEDENTKEEFLKGPIQSRRHIDAQIRRLMGAERKLGDPLENVIRNWTHLIHESMRNMARAEAFNSAQELGLGTIEKVDKEELTRVLGTKVQKRYAVMKEGGKAASAIFDDRADAEDWASELGAKYKANYEVEPRKTTLILFGNMRDNGILSFQDKGQRVYFRVKDPELFNALSNMNKEQFDNVVMRLFRFSKKALTFGATFGPSFRIANMLRDTLHTAVISKSFVPFVDSFKGFMKTMKEDEDFVKFAASGAAFGSSYVRADDARVLAKFIKRVTTKEGEGVLDRILDKPKKLLDMWEKIGSASENAARVSLYATRIKEGREHLEAAFESRDLLDFTMKGDAGAVQFLIQMLPFMNARMQGLYKLGKVAASNPVSFGIKGGMIAAASLLLWAFNHDKDEWKELEDWDKWTYYHFWIGKKHYRIPKPFEVGAIFSSGFESAADAMTKEEDIKFLGRYIQNTFENTFALNPMPQLVRPLIEQWANKTFFTGRPIEGESLQGLKPGERKDVWTSETMQLAGRIGIPPKRAEALVQGYLSTFGMFLLGLSDSVVYHLGDFPTNPTRKIDQYPLVGRFIRAREAPGQSKYITRFYDTMTEMDQLVGTINFYKKVGDFKKAKELSEENKAKLRLKPSLNKARRNLTTINQEIRKTYYSKMTPEEKRTRLDTLAKRRNDQAKKAYEMIAKSR